MLQAPQFKADFFEGNRRRLRELFASSAPIIVTANGQMQSDSYSAFKFRQDSSFWYLTGIDEPNVILVMDGNHEYLIVPERDERLIIFDGEVDYGDMQKTSGVKTIIKTESGWERLGKQLKRTKQVGILEAGPTFASELDIYTNPARVVLLEKLKSYKHNITLTDLRPQLVALRMIKSKQEVAAIQYAIDHTIKVYELISRNLPIYATEQAIAADVAHYFVENQLGYAYEPIIAGGRRATTLHYNKNNAALRPDECLLLDIGAASGPYYCADLTRTVVTKPSQRLQAVYAAVLAVQEFAIGYLKPGVLIKDYETAVNLLMGEKLRELGLVDVIDQASVRQFYPHGTSHFLGLDVHDVGDYTRPLEAGTVLTVEPGIYIKQESIGVRIEDDVLITATDNRVLSADLPKTVASLTIN